MRSHLPLLLALPLALLACDDHEPAKGDQQILGIGDSIMDIHGEPDDIAYAFGDALGMTAESAAIGGTTMMQGEDWSIPDQYVNGDFELLIATGGGNDLGTCVCGETCGPVVDGLIDEDAEAGAIVELVERAVADGKNVVWLGYMRPMPTAEAFTECIGELDTLTDRMGRYAAAQPDVVFVDGSQVGDGTDASLYADDGYHTSVKGSRLLAEAAADAVRDAGWR